MLVAALLGCCLLVIWLPGCGPGGAREIAPDAAGVDGPTAVEEEREDASQPPEILAEAAESWTGDFEGMVERRLIRALVVYNSTNFFFDDNAQPRGISFEALKTFEESINKQLGTGLLKVHVVQIPVRRDQLIPHLRDGKGDLAVANLTITDERRQLVDFSEPTATGVDEIVVSGPAAPAIDRLEDLAAQEIWVRASSSYYDSLQELNESFEQQGLEPVRIRKAEEQLETEDLLEMVATGLLGITIADDYIAEAWASVLDGLQLHPGITVRSGGEIGWMFRKNSPELAKVVNDFVSKNKIGTLLGNILFKRYYADSKWIDNATTGEKLARLQDMIELFKRYGGEYGFDWLMIAAQAYQESGLDHSKVSPSGAIGVMQLLRSTAGDPNVDIPEIEKLENNIHAGNKYLRFILDHYFGDADMGELERHLFAFASYNAGPNRIARLRKRAAEQGFDPNVWFQNVEVVVGREVGREPVQYVSNIFKYYVAYKLSLDRLEERG
jgi:membrane-bound lytic murein transglycosylase MltF